MRTRINKQAWLFTLVEAVAMRSTCIRRQIGAIIVRNNQILSTGYNGAPSQVEDCLTLGCNRLHCESGTHHELCRAVHAEQNAIIQAAKYGTSIDGAILYSNTAPCIICAKMIINSGIKEVVYFSNYANEDGINMLKEGKVICTKYQ